MDFFKNYLAIVEKQYEYSKSLFENMQKDVEKSIDYGFQQLKTLVKQCQGPRAPKNTVN